MSWYTARAQQHPQEQLSKLADLTFNMVGTPADPKLKLKAAEAYGFTLFLCDILCKVLNRVPSNGRGLLEAGQCLERIVHIMTSQGVRLSTASRQDPVGMGGGGGRMWRGAFLSVSVGFSLTIYLSSRQLARLYLSGLCSRKPRSNNIYIYIIVSGCQGNHVFYS
jgi:hypothetical protein